MGITHVMRGEDLINVTPKVLLLRGRSGQRPAARRSPTCRSSSTRSARSCPSAATTWPSRTTSTAATSPRRWSTTWPRSAGARPTASRSGRMPEIVELFRLEDVNPSSAFFDVKKLDHFNGEYIRALDGRRLRRAGPTRGSSTPPRGRPSASTSPTFEAIAPLVQERVKHLVEVPGYVDFLFLRRPADRRAPVGEGHRRRARARRRHPRRTPPPRYADLRLGRRLAARRRDRLRRASTGAKLARPRPHPGRGDRAHAWARRCSSRSRCWVATRPSSACGRPARRLSTPAAPPRRRRRMLRWPFRLVVGLVGSSCVYVGVTFVQVLVGLARRRPGPADAHRRAGCRPVRRRPSPVLQARLDHALELYGTASPPLIVYRRQAGGRPLHRGVSGYDYLRAKGIPEEALQVEVDGHQHLRGAVGVGADPRAGRGRRRRGDRHRPVPRPPSRRDRRGGRPAPARVADRRPRRRAPDGRETVAVALGRIIGYRRLSSFS